MLSAGGSSQQHEDVTHHVAAASKSFTLPSQSRSGMSAKVLLRSCVCRYCRDPHTETSPLRLQNEPVPPTQVKFMEVAVHTRACSCVLQELLGC